MKVDIKQERIKIIQDVLHRLDYLKVKPGSYITNYNTIANFINNIEDVHKTCQVCAKGALFLSYINFHNQVSLQDLKDNNRRPHSTGLPIDVSEEFICDKLTKYFSMEQLNLIEIAFEEEDVNCESGVSLDQEQIDRAIKFGMLHYDHKYRLKMILLNMLENDGKFCP